MGNGMLIFFKSFLTAFSRHNEVPVFLPVIFNEADKLIEAIVEGNSLNFIRQEHVYCTAVTDASHACIQQILILPR